jgi:hypothetical protein
VVVVETLTPSSGLDGVPRITVRPKTALDRRCRGPTSLPALSMLGRRRIRPWADGAPARPCSERWREAELSACCATTASSSPFSYWCTRRSSEVAAFGQARTSMAVAARFWDTHRKSGGASASTLVSRSCPHWCVSCCRVLARVPVALVCGRAAGRQPDSTRVGHRSPRGATPAQDCPVQVIGRGARHPCPALGEQGPAPRRAGISPP